MFRMVTIAAALSCMAASLSAAGPADVRLTVEDVQQITHLTPLHLVMPRELPGAGPGLNFATADNKLVLMVNAGDAAQYARAKEQKTPVPLFHAAVPGIGDEAFDAPSGSLQYVIYLRKGANSASITTYLDRGMTPRIPRAQLEAIAKLVASRL